MKRILVTGVGGYVGQETAKALLEAGHTVFGVGTSLERSDTLPLAVHYETADVRDQTKLAEIFKREQIEVVYHLAGQKSAGACEANPTECLSVNVGGTEAVLLSMKEAQVPHLIYASTWLVYRLSPHSSFLLSEASPVEPTTVYGQSKLKGEELIRQSYERGEIAQYHIMRYGNIVGPSPTPSANFLEFAVKAIKSGQEVEIFGDDYETEDGTVARDMVDIIDVAIANAKAIDHDGSGTFNIATGHAITLKKLLELVMNRAGKELVIKISSPRSPEPASITLDVSAAKLELGWEPRLDIKQTIGRFFAN